MKQFILTFLLGSLGLCCLHAQTVINPTIKSKTSFAIIIDENSYQQTKNAVDAYCRVVEKDGLGTYIVHSAWKSPEEIKNILVRLHKQPLLKLEGAVFIGDIPIPMIRDAQHLSSAFKMNQKRDWKKSSIPSDRFYDDFGLKFKFLKQDNDRKDYFYYSLSAESEQYIDCDIYTSRIRPLEIEGSDKYQQIRDFLNKVVHERTVNANNPLDYLSMARGHGYNSEDEGAWAGEQIALKEQLSQSFKAGGSIRFIDFQSRYPAKFYYLNEVQRPGLDVMLFHHHGYADTQYINGYKSSSDINTSLENAKLFIRSKVPALAKKEGKDVAIETYMKDYDIPRSWCEESFDPKKIEADSLSNLDMDIKTNDIRKIIPSARFILFDACFNGSFYEKDYVTGSYIFNKGTTLVTQGNTVNTIQDKWPDELLGLLNAGMRIGEWHRHVAFLETHLIGDPTYRFAAIDNIKYNINEASILRKGDVAFWRSQLNSPYPDIQALAIRKLSKLKIQGLSDLLKRTYYSSSFMVVRLEAFRQLSHLLDNNYIEVLKSALFDSYELTRRFATDYAADYGSDILIPEIAKAIITNYTDTRLAFNFNECIKNCDGNKMKIELQKLIDATPLYYKKDYEQLLKHIDDLTKSKIESLNMITDTTTTVKNKRLEIVNYRNHPSSFAVDGLLKFIADDKRTIDLRITAAEALGWYNLNSRKWDIIKGLRKIGPSINDAELKAEINKTIRRLDNE